MLSLTFAVGLIHGLGFSFALREMLQLDGPHLVVSLAAFNLPAWKSVRLRLLSQGMGVNGVARELRSTLATARQNADRVRLHRHRRGVDLRARQTDLGDRVVKQRTPAQIKPSSVPRESHTS